MVLSRACDSCRRRKVKCDEADPCSNCRISELRCEQRLPVRRRGPRVAKRRADAEARRAAPDPTSPWPVHAVSSRSPPQQQEQQQEQQQRNTSAPGTLSPTTSTLSRGASNNVVASQTEAIHDQIYAQLFSGFDATGSAGTIYDVVCECIDLYVEYLFCLSPIVHEPMIREGAAKFFAGSKHGHMERTLKTSELQAFTLVTAVVAVMLAFATPSILRDTTAARQASLGEAFFQASRNMLRSYEDHELEHPNAMSITIRLLLSGVKLNTTGRLGACWQYSAEASCLALRMRLYQEPRPMALAVLSYPELPAAAAVEAKLLRNAFTMLHLQEKTQIALETRAPFIDDRRIWLMDGEGLTLSDDGAADIATVPLLVEGAESGGRPSRFETRLQAGFYLRRKIWSKAAELIDGIKCHSKSWSRDREGDINNIRVQFAPHVAAEQDTSATRRLQEMHLDFTELANPLPDWLQNPHGQSTWDSADHGGRDPGVGMGQIGEEQSRRQRRCHDSSYWMQRCNITTIYHSMRLVILQNSIRHGLPGVVGLPLDSPVAWASRKIDIARDFLADLALVPWDYIKVQGETTVDKIRRVGSILLELVQETDSETIRRQAGVLFERTLDVLTRLDSRAVDGLV